jgi:hypothetical protein
LLRADVQTVARCSKPEVCARHPSSQGGSVVRSILLKLSFMLSLVSAGSISAADMAWQSGTETTTGYSGWAGSISELESASPGGQQAGLYGIAWMEHRDEPCWLGIYSRDLNDGNKTVYTNKGNAYVNRHSDDRSVNNHCPGGSGSWTDLSFADNPRYYVRGLAVCTNDKENHRMKGVKLYAAKVWTTKPSVEALSTTILETHAHCDVWHGAVFCPSGAVANGVVLHRQGNAITGLGLKCQAVKF